MVFFPVLLQIFKLFSSHIYRQDLRQIRKCYFSLFSSIKFILKPPTPKRLYYSLIILTPLVQPLVALIPCSNKWLCIRWAIYTNLELGVWNLSLKMPFYLIIRREIYRFNWKAMPSQNAHTTLSALDPGLNIHYVY